MEGQGTRVPAQAGDSRSSHAEYATSDLHPLDSHLTTAYMATIRGTESHDSESNAAVWRSICDNLGVEDVS